MKTPYFHDPIVKRLLLPVLLFVAWYAAPVAFAQGTTFTYQGRLNASGASTSGSYDFRFRLATDPLGSNYVGSPVLTNAVPVAGGLFTVGLNFGAGVFNGSNYWLQVDVKTNGAGGYATLTPLQPITPTPYAIFAAGASNMVGVLSSSALSGTYGNSLNFSNGANTFNGTFSGSGAGLVNVNALTLGGLGAGSFWQLTGNVATANQFVGTVNNQPLQLRANNQRGLRLESVGGSMNLIGGWSNNFAGPGVTQGSIGGGGGESVINPGFFYTNRVLDSYGTIGGGSGNAAGNGTNSTTDARGATVGGGGENTAGAAYSTIGGGSQNAVRRDNSTIGGGLFNVILLPTNSPNGEATIGGGYANQNAGWAATIAGGWENKVTGVSDFIGGGTRNTTSNDYASVVGGAENHVDSYGASIGGGLFNTIETNATYAVIAGGSGNRVTSNSGVGVIGGGQYNVVSNNYSTVGGGGYNLALGISSVVAGGFQNNVLNTDAAIVGGYLNTARGYRSFIGGGTANIASNEYNVIAGGSGNVIAADTAFIGGGIGNYIVGGFSFLGGGAGNYISGGLSTIVGGQGHRANANNSTIVGGLFNTNNGVLAFIGAGSDNTINNSYAVIGGGQRNMANGQFSSIGGGFSNVASGAYSTVAGGGNNTASGRSSFVAGGGGLDAGGFGPYPNTASGDWSSVGGGWLNEASGYSAVVVGGAVNTASGLFGTVAGGFQNIASANFTFAAGNNARATNAGAFVWSDSSSVVTGSTNANSVTMRASGGYRLFSTSGSAGVFLPAGGTSWAAISDRNAKKDFAPINCVEVLEKLATVPITRWHYNWEEGSDTPHLGPMAQDFKAAFYPGRDDKSITTQEADGVALAAIQGLNQKLEVEANRSRAKDAEISGLKERLSRLEAALEQITAAREAVK